MRREKETQRKLKIITVLKWKGGRQKVTKKVEGSKLAFANEWYFIIKLIYTSPESDTASLWAGA